MFCGSVGVQFHLFKKRKEEKKDNFAADGNGTEKIKSGSGSRLLDGGESGASQQQGHGSVPQSAWHLSVWVLHALLVFKWIFSHYSGFLHQHAPLG